MGRLKVQESPQHGSRTGANTARVPKAILNADPPGSNNYKMPHRRDL